MGEACGNIMKPKLYWKRGAILLQTLVMSVLLSLIAVMVLKWVLARYMVANRVLRSSRNTLSAQGYAMQNVNISNWATADQTTNLDNDDATTTRYENVVHFHRQASGSTQFTTTVDDDY